jgi:hypothetical protein
MHAHVIVQRFIETQLLAIHAARRRVLGVAVAALMQGHLLSLSRLARGLGGATGLKAALKRIDRLIGHTRIEAEAQSVAAAIAARLKAQGGPLVIAIDWSAVGPGGPLSNCARAPPCPGRDGGSRSPSRSIRSRSSATPRPSAPCSRPCTGGSGTMSR